MSRTKTKPKELKAQHQGRAYRADIRHKTERRESTADIQLVRRIFNAYYGT